MVLVIDNSTTSTKNSKIDCPRAGREPAIVSSDFNEWNGTIAEEKRCVIPLAHLSKLPFSFFRLFSWLRIPIRISSQPVHYLPWTAIILHTWSKGTKSHCLFDSDSHSSPYTTIFITLEVGLRISSSIINPSRTKSASNHCDTTGIVPLSFYRT